MCCVFGEGGGSEVTGFIASTPSFVDNDNFVMGQNKPRMDEP